MGKNSWGGGIVPGLLLPLLPFGPVRDFGPFLVRGLRPKGPLAAVAGLRARRAEGRAGGAGGLGRVRGPSSIAQRQSGPLLTGWSLVQIQVEERAPEADRTPTPRGL